MSAHAYYCVIHNVCSLRDLCVVRWSFFGRCVFKEGAAKLFYYVVFALFPRAHYQMADLDFLLPNCQSAGLYYFTCLGDIIRQYEPALTATISRSIPA